MWPSNKDIPLFVGVPVIIITMYTRIYACQLKRMSCHKSCTRTASKATGVLCQETGTLTRTLAKLQSELGALLDEAHIGHVELQNMVEHLGRQHQRLEKHIQDSGATARRPPAKPSYSTIVVLTARCTLVQSAVLPSHVVCLSVCLSVCDVGGL